MEDSAEVNWGDSFVTKTIVRKPGGNVRQQLQIAKIHSDGFYANNRDEKYTLTEAFRIFADK